MMRRPFVGGNWKMNTDLESGTALASALATEFKHGSEAIDVVVFLRIHMYSPLVE